MSDLTCPYCGSEKHHIGDVPVNARTEWRTNHPERKCESCGSNWEEHTRQIKRIRALEAALREAEEWIEGSSEVWMSSHVSNEKRDLLTRIRNLTGGGDE